MVAEDVPKVLPAYERAMPAEAERICGAIPHQDLALQWEWLETAVSGEGATSYRLIVAEASEAILASADRITRLYDEIARR